MYTRWNEPSLIFSCCKVLTFCDNFNLRFSKSGHLRVLYTPFKKNYVYVSFFLEHYTMNILYSYVSLYSWWNYSLSCVKFLLCHSFFWKCNFPNIALTKFANGSIHTVSYRGYVIVMFTIDFGFLLTLIYTKNNPWIGTSSKGFYSKLNRNRNKIRGQTSNNHTQWLYSYECFTYPPTY